MTKSPNPHDVTEFVNESFRWIAAQQQRYDLCLHCMFVQIAKLASLNAILEAKRANGLFIEGTNEVEITEHDLVGFFSVLVDDIEKDQLCVEVAEIRTTH